MEKSADSTEKPGVDEFSCALPLKKVSDNLEFLREKIIMFWKIAH